MLILQSCNLNVGKTFKNDHIDASTRQQIKALNDQLFTAIRTGKPGAIKDMLSDTLRHSDLIGMGKTLAAVSSSMHAEGYDVLSEYYVNNKTTGALTTLPDSDYVISFVSLNKEMYVSLLTTNKPESKLMITVVYGKYGSEWKINILQFGQYSFFGKAAPAYYEMAKISYAKNNLIDAANYMGIAKECSNPANQLLKYPQEQEMKTFYERVIKEVNNHYKVPYALENIKTKPKVYRIAPFPMKDAFYPMVYYVSGVSLKDSVGVKAENVKVKQEVDRVFVGINVDKKYVLYWAFDSIPNGHNNPPHRGFIDTLAR